MVYIAWSSMFWCLKWLHNCTTQSNNFFFTTNIITSKTINIELPKFSISSSLWFLIAIKVGNWKPFDWFTILWIYLTNHTSHRWCHLWSNYQTWYISCFIRQTGKFIVSYVFSWFCLKNSWFFYQRGKIFFISKLCANCSSCIKNIFSCCIFCWKSIECSFWRFIS